MESPFAKDADFEGFGDDARDFWIKPKKAIAEVTGPDAAVAEESDSYGDEEDSSEDDDAEELMREYEKLKKERE